jgi:hypothetical protein
LIGCHDRVAAKKESGPELDPADLVLTKLTRNADRDRGDWQQSTMPRTPCIWMPVPHHGDEPGLAQKKITMALDVDDLQPECTIFIIEHTLRTARCPTGHEQGPAGYR